MRWSVAASVILCVALSALYLWNDSDWFFEQKFPQQANWEQSKLAEVELILADGKRVPLGGSGRQIQDHGVSGIKDDSLQGLTYVQAKALDEKVTVVLYNTLKVPTGGFYQLELSDGTRVWLNAESELRFPVQFGTGEREVYLKGEAYFDVARNVSKPFVVEVDEMKVKVLGTSFNVKSYVDEPGVYTTLVEGSVAILRDGQPEKKIKPGEQAYYNKGVGTLSIAEVDVNEFTSWKDGVFYFKDIALEEILRIVSRWYDLEVFYMNQGAKSVIYSGKLPMYSSVEDVLRKFEISGDVRFELKGRTLTVFDK